MTQTTDAKPWYKSKALWSLTLAFLIQLAKLTGWVPADVDPELLDQVAEHGSSAISGQATTETGDTADLLSLILTGLAGYFRVTAKKAIKAPVPVLKKIGGWIGGLFKKKG